MLSATQEIQLKIYYLFMLADGSCTAEEKKKFASICRSMDAREEEEKEVIAFCENALRVLGQDNAQAVNEEVKKLLDETGGGFFGSINRDKRRQAETLWTLINLGYADVVYSEAEKKVTSFLCSYWAMDPLTLGELRDTAETVLALTRQKEWVKSTDKPARAVSEAVAVIEQAISRMARNVELLISEAETK